MNADESIAELFDVFLCHNSEDKPAVREISKRLFREGVKPWLDEDQIRPGTTWQTALGQQIATIKSAAVFVGAGGLGPWQGEEIQAFLNEFIERGLPVIPIILSSVIGTPELPWTLKNRHRVDFRISDPDPVKQLIWGITGERPTVRETLIPDKNELSEPRTRYPVSRLFPPLAEQPNQEDRTQLEILRRRVIEHWVDGVLRHSLYNEVLISLGKRQMDEFVDAPWKYRVELRNGINSGQLTDRDVSAVYDATGLLLILGEPGSGKTTTLLDLARTLLERAQKDIRERVAVVLNLSSWRKNHPIAEWISVELSEKYRVPRKIARHWLQHNYLVPLLDGLDEVETSMQPDCVAAINSFIEESNPSGLVVCCRLNEYRWLPERLKLSGAIRLEPLSEGEVDEYLKKSGPELATLREAVETDPVLKELTETPLMLSVMSLAFQGASGDELIGQRGDSPEECRMQIFDLYVEQMFHRKTAASIVFPKEKTIGWLSWLAANMREHSLSFFLLEGLQPSWLGTRAKRAASGTVVALSVGSIFALSGWLMGGAMGLGPFFAEPFGLSTLFGVGLGCWSRSHLKNGIVSGSIGGLIAALIAWFNAPGHAEIAVVLGPMAAVSVGAIGGLGIGSLNHITLVETMSWKWKRFWKSTIPGLIIGLSLGPVVGLFFALLQGPLLLIWGPGYGLELGLRLGLFCPLISGLIGGFADIVKSDKAAPNQGINLSRKNFVAVFFAAWLILGLSALATGLTPGSVLTFALCLALITGLNRGGSAVIKHYALRLILWLTGSTPFKFAKFLDHCARLIFLKKVGGGYIFIHRMLLEYFAELTPQSKRLEVGSKASK